MFFCFRGAIHSCRDGLNVRNGSNVLKILHSIGEKVDYVLHLVLVVLLIKHMSVTLF